MYIPEFNTIFLHIPKTGGASIEKALGVWSPKVYKHDKPSYYEKNHRRQFKDWFVFTIVRNPWSKFVSSFYYHKKLWNKGVNRHKPMRKAINGYDDINAFISDYKSDKRLLNDLGFQPQHRWITVSGDHTTLLPNIDYVGHTETLSEDFKKVKQHLGLESPKYQLPHFNKTDHEPYHEELSASSKRVISKLYKKDIELLDYECK
jgi:hypothetical protein